MNQITHDVTLPVGIKIGTGKKQQRMKQVKVRSITMAESYAKMMECDDPNAMTGMLDLAAMTYVPELNRTLTYEEVANASRQDGNALEIARAVVEKKEREGLTTTD